MTGKNYRGLKTLFRTLGSSVRDGSAGRLFVERVGKRPDDYARLLDYVRLEHPYLLEDLAASFGEGARKEQLLEGTSVYDKLTGLRSRAYFDERLCEEFAEARRTGNPLAVALFDIDHFKRVNDTYGHRAGDAVLRNVANLMRKASRRSDINARYGGEELVKLMPRTDAGGAELAAEGFRERVGNTPTDVDGRRIYVTISGGVSAYPIGEYVQTPDELLETADRTLYNAKHGGRNRISSVSAMRPETIEGITKRLRG